MRKAKITFRELASRISGVSLPIFGISWNPPASEREIVRETFIFLEDRRALYNDYAYEIDREVTQSVLAIRAELTSALKRLPEGSEAAGSFKAMRAACREYLDRTHHRFGPFGFTAELGRLRAIIGVHVSYLAVKYGIDLDGELLQVIPPDLRDAAFVDDEV